MVTRKRLAGRGWHAGTRRCEGGARNARSCESRQKAEKYQHEHGVQHVHGRAAAAVARHPRSDCIGRVVG